MGFFDALFAPKQDPDVARRLAYLENALGSLGRSTSSLGGAPNSPTGAAGGSLTGSYPNPTLNQGSYTDATASRAVNGTVYTAASTKTRFVMIRIAVSAGGSGSWDASIGSNLVWSSVASTTLESDIVLIVPPGGTYNVAKNGTQNGALTKWFESDL